MPRWAKELPDSRRRVRPMPDRDRPSSALSHLSAKLANSELDGAIVVTFQRDGGIDYGCFGKVLRRDLFWASEQLKRMLLMEEM